MRILYFSRDYTTHDHRFLQSLSKTRHEVHFLRLEGRYQQVEQRPLPTGVHEIDWQGGRGFKCGWKWLSLLRELQGILHKLRPDIVHAGPIQSTSFLVALTGYKPLVSMSWGSDLLKDADRNFWMQWITRFTLDRTAVLAGDCRAVREKAVAMGFPGDRIVLFPWGVDLELFSPGDWSEQRNRLRWTDNFVILSLRSWEPLYGVDVVARAFVEAASIVPDIRLLLLGTGSLEDQVREILAKGGVLDKVHFGGQVANPELPDYYRAADLYVSASHSDGSSVSLMEALACGTPVLVSDIPGNREWITTRKNGWLFQDGDAGDLAAGIINAVRQRHTSGEKRKNARNLAEERADWGKNFEKLMLAYEKALDIRPGGGQHE